MDMLSNLPEEIKEKVLSFLPLKEAVRTSILSSDWRQTWTSFPGIVIWDAEIILYNNPRKVENYYYKLIKNVDSMIVINSGSVFEGNLGNVRVCKMRGGLDVKYGVISFKSSYLRDLKDVKNIEFLRLNFEDENEAAFVHALLLRAPHLHSLVIHVNLPGEKRGIAPVREFWDIREKWQFGINFLKHLQTLKIVNIKYADSVFSFLRFIVSATQLTVLLIGDYLVDLKDHKTIVNKLIEVVNLKNTALLAEFKRPQNDS